MAERRAIEVAEAGLLSSVQDQGRRHVGAIGVSPSGASDWFSARAANRLVGNSDSAAVIEITMTGATFVCGCSARIAVTGAACLLEINDTACELWRSYELAAGDRLNVGRPASGVRSYVAFDGGVDAAIILGSRATDIGARFGGLHGRKLAAGDVVPLLPAPESPVGPRVMRADRIPALGDDAPLRTLPAPDNLRVGVHAIESLCESAYTVSPASNRQALRLSGTSLDVIGGTDVISAGVCAGCVQILNDGLPVLLLSEHQTTGGYAMALCVCAADLPRAGQLAPGNPVRFARTTYADAREALHELVARLAGIGPAT